MPSTMAASPVRKGTQATRPQTKLATAAPFVFLGAGAGYAPAGGIDCGEGGGICDMRSNLPDAEACRENSCSMAEQPFGIAAQDLLRHRWCERRFGQLHRRGLRVEKRRVRTEQQPLGREVFEDVGDAAGAFQGRQVEGYRFELSRVRERAAGARGAEGVEQDH